jgi:outer membrane lipoprotein-sorting protein
MEGSVADEREKTLALSHALGPGALLLLGFLAFSNVPAQESAEPLLDRMAQAYRSLETVEARFTQVKSYPQLQLTDPPEIGRLYADLGDAEEPKIRVEIEEPERRIVTVKEGRYLLYQPAIKQAIEGKVINGDSGGTGFASYFLGDLSRAQRDYNVSFLGDEVVDERSTKHLRLTLKQGSQAYYRRIELWISTQLWMPVRQELVEPNQSVVRIQFDDIRLNMPLDQDIFEINLPSDVERIRG